MSGLQQTCTFISSTALIAAIPLTAIALGEGKVQGVGGTPVCRENRREKGNSGEGQILTQRAERCCLWECWGVHPNPALGLPTPLTLPVLCRGSAWWWAPGPAGCGRPSSWRCWAPAWCCWRSATPSPATTSCTSGPSPSTTCGRWAPRSSMGASALARWTTSVSFRGARLWGPRLWGVQGPGGAALSTPLPSQVSGSSS